MREAIEKGLLDLYEAWRQESEPVLTAQELRTHLELTFVRIDTIIPITLSYALGDVFGGHSVDVYVDEKGQVVSVNLVG